MTDQEREARNREDRKWLDKFNADMEKLRSNREKVSLEVLQTRYARAYNTLVAEVSAGAVRFADMYINLLVGTLPRHPEDIAGNEWLDSRIAAILEEEHRPGGCFERHVAALLEQMDKEEFIYLWQEIRDRIFREAFDPYRQRHSNYTRQDLRLPPNIKEEKLLHGGEPNV